MVLLKRTKIMKEESKMKFDESTLRDIVRKAIQEGKLFELIFTDVKKIFFQDGMVVLQSLNPKYPPVTVPARKIKMYIVGKVVGLHRQY